MVSRSLIKLIAAMRALLPVSAWGETTTQTIELGGKQRSYDLVVPASAADQPLPLVVALHPYPADASVMAELTGLSALAEKEGFIVAYPNGINGGSNALGCCGDEDDVGFVKAVVAKASADHKVDPARVYATGISNGADLSYRLATEASDIFAAIGPVSGGMTGDFMAKKTGNVPTSPVSLITFYGGKERLKGMYRVGANFWLEKQNCTAKPSQVEGTAIERIDGVCANGSEAIIYALPDMGHAWPGSDGTQKKTLAYAPSPLNATELIWRFFRDHPKK